MQEHSNQVGKIILNPLLTPKEESKPQDYYSQAEKIVNERREREEAEKHSLLNKFRLPGAAELAHDISPEEKARAELEERKRQIEEQQQKLLEQQQQVLQQPAVIPAAASLGPMVQPAVVTATTGLIVFCSKYLLLQFDIVMVSACSTCCCFSSAI